MKKTKINIRSLEAKIKKAKGFTQPNARKEKPQESAKETDDGHMINLSEVSGGMTFKGTNYGYNAFKFLMNLTDNESAGVSANAYKERKKIYQKFDYVDQAYEDKVAKQIKANFKFGSGPGANFCSSAKSGKKLAGKSYPYTWQAHHILPQEVFRGNDDKKRVFNDEQCDLIEATGYNINHGHNIIFLPGSGADKYVPVHALAQHVGSHPNYSDLVYETVNAVKNNVVKELDKIKKELKEAEKDKHRSVKFEILKELRDAEQDMWEEIVEASEESVKNLLTQSGDISDLMKERKNWFKLS